MIPWSSASTSAARPTSPPVTSSSRRRSRSSTGMPTSPRSTPRAAWPSTSRSSRAAATSAPTGRRRTARSVSSRSTPSSRPCVVTFTVEPARVEQSTNFDRLQLDIETDGSITPKEALASAGATLRSLVDLVANLSDDPQGLELGEVASVAAGSPDLELAIEDLDLSERPRDCLSAPRSTPSASCSRRPRTTCSTSPTSGRRASTRSRPSSTKRGLSLRG